MCLGGKYRQWITLFEHLDDDEYDGDPGDNDDEEPRILVDFIVTKPQVHKQQPTPSAKKYKEARDNSTDNMPL